MTYLLAWGVDMRPYIFVLGAVLTPAIFAALGLVVRRVWWAAVLGAACGFLLWIIAFVVWMSGLDQKRTHEFSLTSVEKSEVLESVPMFLNDEVERFTGYLYEIDEYPGAFVMVPTDLANNEVFVNDEVAPPQASIVMEYTYDWSSLRAYTITDAKGFELVRDPNVSSFIWPVIPKMPIGQSAN